MSACSRIRLPRPTNLISCGLTGAWRMCRFVAWLCVNGALFSAPAATFVAAENVSAEKHIGEANLSPDVTNPAVVSPDLAVYTAIVFLIVLVVLWKFAWGP